MSRVASRLLVGKLVARPFVQGLRKKKKKKRKNKKTPRIPFPFLSPKFERKRKKKRKETIVSSRGEGKFSALLIHSKQVSRGCDALRHDGCTPLLFFSRQENFFRGVCNSLPSPPLLPLQSGRRKRKEGATKGGSFYLSPTTTYDRRKEEGLENARAPHLFFPIPSLGTDIVYPPIPIRRNQRFTGINSK